MNSYEAIFLRKSSRKYKQEPLTKGILSKIQSIIDAAPRINKDIDLQIKLVFDGERIQKSLLGIGNFGKVIAPHYLIVSTEEKEGSFENLGYATEHIVLKLTSMKIATCWLGVAGKVKKEVLAEVVGLAQNRLPIVIISLGWPEKEEDLFRKDSKEAKRKDVKDFVMGHATEEWMKIFEAVRLAPSAGNSQPWRFLVEENKVHLFCAKPRNFLTRKIFGTINFADVGIALYHVVVAAKHYGKNISIQRLSRYPEIEHVYITSIIEP